MTVAALGLVNSIFSLPLFARFFCRICSVSRALLSSTGRWRWGGMVVAPRGGCGCEAGLGQPRLAVAPVLGAGGEPRRR